MYCSLTNMLIEPTTVDLLTIPEVAKLLRMSVSNVRRLQQGRKIPFFKIGGCIRFSKDDVFTYLGEQRVGAIRK